MRRSVFSMPRCSASANFSGSLWRFGSWAGETRWTPPRVQKKDIKKRERKQIKQEPKKEKNTGGGGGGNGPGDSFRRGNTCWCDRQGMRILFLVASFSWNSQLHSHIPNGASKKTQTGSSPMSYLSDSLKRTNMGTFNTRQGAEVLHRWNSSDADMSFPTGRGTG